MPTTDIDPNYDAKIGATRIVLPDTQDGIHEMLGPLFGRDVYAEIPFGRTNVLKIRCVVKGYHQAFDRWQLKLEPVAGHGTGSVTAEKCWVID